MGTISCMDISNLKTLENDLIGLLVTQLMPQASSPIIIEQDFGQKFDFSAQLNPENNLDVATYQQRLKAFEHHLFDYIYGFQRSTKSGELENSGHTLDFLKSFLLGSIQIKSLANSVPTFNGQPLIHFIPEKAITIPYLKVPIKEGFVAIIPHIEHKNGGIQISSKAPCYLINEPDAESIGLAIAQLLSQKISTSEKLNIALSFIAEARSNQAKTVLHCFLNNFCAMGLTEMVSECNQKIKFSIDGKNKKAFQHCCVACPHLLKLELLQRQLMLCPRPLLAFDANNFIVFHDKASKLLNELTGYMAAINLLSSEYAIIYKRVQEEYAKLNKESLNTLEPATSSANIEASSSITHEALQTTEALQPAETIRYARRVSRWFKERFASNKKKSSVFYHTALPIEADNIVIKHGKKSIYDNKTYIGQQNTRYTICGKLIDDETHEEAYCRFHLTIDSRGICYHRDCKKCTWEELNAEAPQYNIEDEKYELDDEIMKLEEPSVLQDTRFSVTLYSPLHKHKIVLYKEQFN